MNTATLTATTVGAYEAKTRFSKLLARVAKGETITVTLRGHDVAKIVPASTQSGFDWEGFKALRREIIEQNKGKEPFDYKAILDRDRKH